MLAALMNLLHNAFNFTQPHTEVTLKAHALAGTYPDRRERPLRRPAARQCRENVHPLHAAQRSTDRTGMGLGLSIARKSIEADGGTLSVQDVPGTGCIFTIDLPCHSLG